MWHILLKIIRAVFAVIGRVLEYMAMAMLIGMVVIICYQVVLRYVFNHSPSWSEEIAILLMIWFGILSIPIGLKHNLHIGIEYFYQQCSPRVQYVISRLVFLLVGGFGVIMVVYGTELVQFMTMSTLPATKLPSAVEYAVVPLSGIMLIYNACELFFVSYQSFLKESQPSEQR